MGCGASGDLQGSRIENLGSGKEPLDGKVGRGDQHRRSSAAGVLPELCPTRAVSKNSIQSFMCLSIGFSSQISLSGVPLRNGGDEDSSFNT
jgi:hypothetical protein